MESSGSSSSVSGFPARIPPTEGNEVLVEASKDLLRAHVRLIMAGVLTMEESKPTLRRAFGALQGSDFEVEGNRLLRAGDRLERLLKDREEVKSRRPLMVAAHQVTRERIEGDWGIGWTDEQWREREAMLVDRLTREKSALLEVLEQQIWGSIV